MSRMQKTSKRTKRSSVLFLFTWLQILPFAFGNGSVLAFGFFMKKIERRAQSPILAGTWKRKIVKLPWMLLRCQTPVLFKSRFYTRCGILGVSQKRVDTRCSFLLFPRSYFLLRFSFNLMYEKFWSRFITKRLLCCFDFVIIVFWSCF